MAYTPWLILVNFTNSNTKEIMVNLPVGGSGALIYYYVISFLINPREGFVIDLPHLYPIKIDGTVPYKLEGQHDIAGTSHAC